MFYRILIKQIGVKNVNELINFELSSPIKDICAKDKSSIFFVWNKYIGLINNNKINPFWSGRSENQEQTDRPIYGTLECSSYFFPSSIYYLKKNNCLYTVENSGRILRRIEINSDFTTEILNKIEKIKVENIFKKHPKETKTSLYVSNNEYIYWCSDISNRIYEYKSGKVNPYCGSGKPGYSIFNNMLSCKIMSVNGIDCIKNTLYFCDTGNNFIRYINGNSLKTIYNKLKNPKKIRNIREKCIFIEENCIRLLNNNEVCQSPVYTSDKLIDFCDIGNNEILILESL